MKMKRMLLLLVFLFVMFSAANGCSRLSGPSDEEAIAAIKDGIENSIIFNLKITSPIVILERGKKMEDGSYPIRVEFTVVDNRTARNEPPPPPPPPSEHGRQTTSPAPSDTMNTPKEAKVNYVIHVFRKQDQMGNYVWSVK